MAGALDWDQLGVRRNQAKGCGHFFDRAEWIVSPRRRIGDDFSDFSLMWVASG